MLKYIAFVSSLMPNHMITGTMNLNIQQTTMTESLSSNTDINTISGVLKMRKIYTAMICTLFLALLGFVVVYEPKETNNNLPSLAGSIGNLKEYELVLDCDLEKVEQEVTIARIRRVPLREDEAISVAKSFGLDDPETIELSEDNTLRIGQGNKNMKFYDQNNILYREQDIKPVVEEYSEENMIQIADRFLDKILATWDIESQVNINVEKVAPCWTSTTVYLNNTEQTVTRAVGVFYSLELGGVKLAGAGSDFTVIIAEDRVIGADLHIPSVFEGGKKELTVTPLDAIENMIARESSKYESQYGPDEPDSGTLIIDNIEPVHYWHHKDEMPKQLPVYYMITGKVIKDSLEKGEPIEFRLYEHSTS